MELIHANGFENVVIQKEKPIVIPDDILIRYLSQAEIDQLKTGSTGIFSVTVFAQKPSADQNPSAEKKCVPGAGCC
jgi:hypothetical protein